MTFMPQNLSSIDAHRLDRRGDGIASLRVSDWAERTAPSIFSLIFGLFAAKSDGERAGDSPRQSFSADLFPSYLERGIALYELGHHHRALADFRKALRLNWRDEEAATWIVRAEAACEHPGRKRRFQVFARSN